MRIIRRIASVQMGFIFLILFLLTSCQWDQRIDPSLATPDVVSFSKDIIPTFQAQCSANNCHGGTVSPDLRKGAAYNDLIDGSYIDTLSPENSYLYQKINIGGSMAGHSDDVQRALILKWIQQGAKDN